MEMTQVQVDVLYTLGQMQLTACKEWIPKDKSLVEKWRQECPLQTLVRERNYNDMPIIFYYNGQNVKDSRRGASKATIRSLEKLNLIGRYQGNQNYIGLTRRGWVEFRRIATKYLVAHEAYEAVWARQNQWGATVSCTRTLRIKKRERQGCAHRLEIKARSSEEALELAKQQIAQREANQVLSYNRVDAITSYPAEVVVTELSEPVIKETITKARRLALVTNAVDRLTLTTQPCNPTVPVREWLEGKLEYQGTIL